MYAAKHPSHRCGIDTVYAAPRETGGGAFLLAGRELAAEIERVFEAKVNPCTLKERARRMEAGTNVPTVGNQATTPPNAGDSGDIITPQEVVVRLDVIVKKGKSVRDAATTWRPVSLAFLPVQHGLQFPA